MCLSPEAIALFLSLLAPEIISTGPGEITVHAQVRDVLWVRDGDSWCTTRTEARYVPDSKT